jgi:opacity protein-like surface antigen
MIRSLVSTAALGGITLSLTLPAFGQAGHFYVSGGIGPALTEDATLKEFNGPVAGKVKFDTGFQFRVAGGYHITDWLATELESGVSYNNIKSITGATETDGSLANIPVLANLVVRCPKLDRFVPYIGGGLGMSSAVLNADDLVVNGTRLSGTQTDAVFAYHGFAGLRYNINDRMAVSVAYRYFGTSEPTWDADYVYGGGTGRTRFGENRTHSVTAAFTFNF